MNISDLPALLFEGVLQKWKRRVIVYAICAVCALGIVVESISIARILMERAFGPIGGRLLVAGVLAVVLVTALIILWQLEKRARAAHAAENAGATGDNDPRVALIAQAINLGYTFARGFGPEKPDTAAPAEETEADRQADPTRPSAQAAE